MFYETKIQRSLRRFRNVLLDLRYGRILYGSVENPYAHLGANSTENSNYSSLETIFKGQIQPDDVLVDVGCGKGRVINWWLSQGVKNRIVGIELNKEIAEETRVRLRRFHNVEIIIGDAVNKIPEDATLFYLYNPFNSEVMYSFKERLNQLLLKRSVKKAKIFYLNCKHLDVFKSDPQCLIVEGTDIHPYAIIEIFL